MTIGETQAYIYSFPRARNFKQTMQHGPFEDDIFVGAHARLANVVSNQTRLVDLFKDKHKQAPVYTYSSYCVNRLSCWFLPG